MLIKYVAVIASLVVGVNAFSQSNEAVSCRSSKPRTTPYGVVYKTECGSAAIGYRDSINVNDIPILSDTRLFNEGSNKDRSITIYTSGASNVETGCAPRLYLLDLSMTPVKVIAFGVKKACNEFHWASWGEKRSVIALKNNVKFTYENGKMTLPASGEKLWKAIEPPHAGAGLAEEDAIAFAEEVPLPK